MSNNMVLPENSENAVRRISAWWHGKPMDRPCLSFSLTEGNKDIFSLLDLNRYWPGYGEEPYIESLVESMIEAIRETHYFGEAIPILPHSWGGRGTPMTAAAYLGGEVELRDDTVWVKPVIDDWGKFNLRFDEENIFLKRSFHLFKLAIEKSDGEYLPALPDFGDALTVLSLLRGVDRLLIDLIENKEAVLEARDKFVQLWPKIHKKFWDVYSQKFPGDISWLSWAPGKTYACQCDFSTMISPQMFIEFVVPEIESIGKYLDYIIWHLDGPDEIKHLDILLDLPEVKAVQWGPGAGAPPVSSPRWLPMLKRIQGKGRGLLVYAENEEEVKLLLKSLSPKGLFIFGGFTGKTRKEAIEYIEMVSRLSKDKMIRG